MNEKPGNQDAECKTRAADSQIQNPKSESRNLKTWWPHHVFGAGAISLIFLSVLFYLAGTYQVPDDAPEIIPLPDDGQYIPGPEWFFLILWQPFWFFTGMKKKYLALTGVIPLLILAYLVVLPFIQKIPFHKIPGLGFPFRKIREMEKGVMRKAFYVVPVLLLAGLFLAGTYQSGYQAKLYGCESCHNAAMGPRMYIPPEDVAEYYNVDRARQIKVGKYRAGKSIGVDKLGKHIYDVTGTQSYKDANWQMRHMYEPTFTW